MEHRQRREGHDRRLALTATLLWLLADAIVFVPGGVWTRIGLAKERVEQNRSASPFDRTCYSCGHPAVTWADYDDGSRKYFCKDHPPPSSVQAGSPGNQGPPGFNPLAMWVIVGAVFGLGTVRSVAHLGWGLRRRVPTVRGAVAAVGFAVLTWWWFGVVGT